MLETLGCLCVTLNRKRQYLMRGDRLRYAEVLPTTTTTTTSTTAGDGWFAVDVDARQTRHSLSPEMSTFYP